MEKIEIKVKRLTETAILPKFATEGSACADMYSDEDVTIYPNEIYIVPTGLAVELPKGYELQVRCRSGFGFKKITLGNGVGTVDMDYRGDVGVIVFNQSDSPIHIKKGDRIAQAAIREVPEVVFIEVNELSDTERGTGGFGSTGVR